MQLEIIVNAATLTIGSIKLSRLIDLLATFTPLSDNDLESPTYAKIELIVSVASAGIVEKLIVCF